MADPLLRARVGKRIILVDADRNHRSTICAILERGSYRATPLHSIHVLEGSLLENDCLAVVIDIDTIQVDNRYIRELTVGHPQIYFFGLSSEAFHPELKEAICYHIYACIRKPVDPDELLYWLRSIEEDAE